MLQGLFYISGRKNAKGVYSGQIVGNFAGFCHWQRKENKNEK